MIIKLKKLLGSLREELLNFEIYLGNQEIKEDDLNDRDIALKNKGKAVVSREAKILNKTNELAHKEVKLNKQEEILKDKEIQLDKDRVEINKKMDKLDKVKGDSA